jgi:hypothetical protein
MLSRKTGLIRISLGLKIGEILFRGGRARLPAMAVPQAH